MLSNWLNKKNIKTEKDPKETFIKFILTESGVMVEYKYGDGMQNAFVDLLYNINTGKLENSCLSNLSENVVKKYNLLKLLEDRPVVEPIYAYEGRKINGK